MDNENKKQILLIDEYLNLIDWFDNKEERQSVNFNTEINDESEVYYA